MNEIVNPLVPTAYDVVFGGFAVLLVALQIATTVSIVRHASKLSLLALVLWLVAVWVLPVVGAALWFVSGRGAASAAGPHGSPA